MTCALLTIVIGGTVANASTENSPYFDVKHTNATSVLQTSLVSPHTVATGGGGGGCGIGGANTGWVDYYSSDESALLQMCSYDAGGHTMVTDIQVYSFVPGDYISSAYAVGKWDDGTQDADRVTASGDVAYLELEHTFNSSGYHNIDVQGGFYSTYSEGFWEENQSLTLN